MNYSIENYPHLVKILFCNNSSTFVTDNVTGHIFQIEYPKLFKI